jgi:predicted GH43/DUF377 family glycosyl hydrolase
MPLNWKKRLLLEPKDFEASRNDWEVVGAFNPAAVWFKGEVVLVVRVAERPKEKRAGFVASPRWSKSEGLLVDWLPEENIEHLDPRVVRFRDTGLVRLTFISHLRVVRCGDGDTVERVENWRFEPKEIWEEYGVEDPRTVEIDGRLWMTYVAVSRFGPATALASSVDFRTFERHGVIFCPENKDVVLFPERFGDRYACLHRPNGATPFTRPSMWFAWSNNLKHWGENQPLFTGTNPWETGRVGAGTPPIRTPEGWLEIYHGNVRPTCPGEVGCYQAAAMLLDLENPYNIVSASSDPILSPSEVYEQQGFVPNVVFPTGIVSRGDDVLVYYGASDTFTAVASISRRELIDCMQTS